MEMRWFWAGEYTTSSHQKPGQHVVLRKADMARSTLNRLLSRRSKMDSCSRVIRLAEPTSNEAGLLRTSFTGRWQLVGRFWLCGKGSKQVNGRERHLEVQ